MRFVTILVALAALAKPVMAQNAPANLRPTRDVAVTYRVTSSWEPTHQMRMAWAAAARKMRVEKLGEREWTLLDQNAGSAVTVMEAQRMIMTVPSSTAAAMIQTIQADARFARKGTTQVAGTSCTDWEVTVPQGKSVVCITEDGVMLRSVATAEEEDAFRMEATSVQYSPPPTFFIVPQGYRQMPGGNTPPAR
jgi:ribosomal silencing factor RsfS